MRKPALWLLFAVLTLFAAVALPGKARVTADQPDPGLPDTPFVVRVYYNSIADIERLVEYDLWEFNNLEQRYVLVSVDQTAYRRLEKAGWRLEVDEEATAFLQENDVNTFYGGYRTVDELYADMQTMATSHPDIVELVDYGDSYCKSQGGCITLGGDAQPGYDLLALRITNQAIPGPKPVFFLMANIHAREITTPELAMRMAGWLLDGYGVEADPTWIVDSHEVWIVPTANPDGHWLVELGTVSPYNGNPFYQRKNADRSNGCTVWPPSSISQYGVDLNRNHSFMYNSGGSSSSPCSQTYRGPNAASEPEVDQLQTLVASIIPDQKGPDPNDPAPEDTVGFFITMHSYSELVLWPWGYTSAPAPNKAGLETIGDKLATYNGYTSCQPSVCLYVASGTSDDWAYGELGVPSYTFEVGTQFMPPYSQVDSIQWPDNGPALQYAARVARAPYMLAYGPDVLNIETVRRGPNRLLLRATADDSQNGNNNISQVVYAVDVPYWESGYNPFDALPRDGQFNAPVELAIGRIRTDLLAPGRHTLYLQAQDSAGHWGPVSATFFTVRP